MNALARASLALVFTAIGCAPVEDAPEGLDRSAQDIVNGNLLSDATATAYGLVTISWNGSNVCSGVVYKNAWVLTAAHCFNFTAPTSGVAVRYNGQAFASDRVRRVSTSDLALVHLATPLTVSGSATGFTQPLYRGTLPALQGSGLYCFGVGTQGFAPGGGALIDWRPRWAYMTVSSYWLEGPFYSFAPNASGQIQGGGDSGGPCFRYENGVMSLTGIQRNAGRFCANTPAGQPCSDANATSIGWADQTYVAHYAATINQLTGGPLPLPR